ncbi:MAG TPA: restriction endonuclease [Candidatus Paceibacterota bacterium]|nr:restriction endonuclease [Candidatus Paceibacterota bacterium]
MDWKKYEKEIFNEFKLAYPDAKISYNQKLLGKYSKKKRQIDVLIEFTSAQEKIKLIVDGKYYNKKVDVKEVESFMSMAKDVEAQQAILITNKGFSKAAINSAYYGSEEIELDILNFEEFKHFQGRGGIPYAGDHAVYVPAPIGWILDINKNRNALATFYQRGLNLIKQ